jgi:hypothetical protein
MGTESEYIINPKTNHREARRNSKIKDYAISSPSAVSIIVSLVAIVTSSAGDVRMEEGKNSIGIPHGSCASYCGKPFFLSHSK